MIREGQWYSRVEPHWQETPRPKHRHVSKGKNGPRKPPDSVSAAEVCLLMLKWKRP